MILLRQQIIVVMNRALRYVTLGFFCVIFITSVAISYNWARKVLSEDTDCIFFPLVR